jgi:hypothetical protein
MKLDSSAARTNRRDTGDAHDVRNGAATRDQKKCTPSVFGWASLEIFLGHDAAPIANHGLTSRT